MSSLWDRINETVAYIKQQTNITPETGIILGTGLGALVGKISTEKVISYTDLPHFAVSTVESHAGNLIFGELAGKKVVAMQGRFHFYEGYTMEQITFPIRVMKALGCTTLIVSNACGGLNTSFAQGDIMAITDHINLLGTNPLIGPNDERLGSRFPDMCEPYNRALLNQAKTVAAAAHITLREGVYAGLSGPCLETAAEYRYLRTIGADVVGMSTVPEVIVAAHAGLKTLGLSVITDLCDPDNLKPVDIADIIAIANNAEPALVKIIEQTVGTL